MRPKRDAPDAARGLRATHRKSRYPASPGAFEQWLRRIREGLSYWRDIETVLRIAGYAVFLAGSAGFLIVQLQSLPAWVSVVVAFIAGTGFGMVISTVAGGIIRRSRAAIPPIQPEHNPQRYRLHDGVLWYLASWFRGGGVRLDGPLCPVDKSTLGFLSLDYGPHQVRAISGDDVIGRNRGALVCPIDQQQYFFGNSPKPINTARRSRAGLRR